MLNMAQEGPGNGEGVRPLYVNLIAENEKGDSKSLLMSDHYRDAFGRLMYWGRGTILHY